jgi:hypothetical protein
MTTTGADVTSALATRLIRNAAGITQKIDFTQTADVSPTGMTFVKYASSLQY